MTKARILIVEDQEEVASEIQQRLCSLGYEPLQSTACAEQALALAQQLSPDLVLMDIRLRGEMDGIEAAGQMRTLCLPVVYMTGYFDSATLDRAKRTEPCGYVIKPFETRELQTAIELGLYKHRMEQDRQRLIERLQAALAKVKTLTGLLPICAYCKKIKDDTGYWEQVEHYIMNHTQATFTHGMCLGCFERVKRELEELENNPAAEPILAGH